AQRQRPPPSPLRQLRPPSNDRPALELARSPAGRHTSQLLRGRVVRQRIEVAAMNTTGGRWRVIQQAATSRPKSFPGRPRGPRRTSRRPTRGGQSRPQRRFQASRRAFASPPCRVELVEGLSYFLPPGCEVV